VCWTTASGVNAIHALYALARVAAVLDPPGQRCWAEQGAMLGPALWRLLLVRPAWSASIVVPAVPPADCIDMRPCSQPRTADLRTHSYTTDNTLLKVAQGCYT